MSMFTVLFEKCLERSEHKTKRLDITIDDRGNRIFFTGYLNKESKTWLDVGEEPVVEGTLDVDLKNRLLYLNRLDAWRRGKGFGLELLEYGIQYAIKKYGVTKARGYIESSNIASQSMLRKMGFGKREETKEGAYWEKIFK